MDGGTVLRIPMELDVAEAKASLLELEAIVDRIADKFQNLVAEMERLGQVARTTG